MKAIKILSLVLVLAMVLGMFAACGGNTTPTTTAPKATDAPATDAPATDAPVVDEKEYKWGTAHEVTWTSDGQPDQADATAVLRYEERNALYFLDTGNTRECIPFSYNYQTLGALFEGDNLPTVFYIPATEPVKLIKNGWGRDITAQVEAVGIDLSKFNQAILDTYKDADGKLYGLPYSAYAMCIVCNGNLFTEAGLVNDDGTPKVPTTWDEVIEYGNIINAKTGKGGFALSASDNIGGWNFSNVAWNFNADLAGINDDGTFWVKVNSPEAVAAMSMYQKLVKSSGFYGDPVTDTIYDALALIKAGQCAMGFANSEIVAPLSDTSKDGMDADQVYMVAIPAGPTGTRTNLTGGAGKWFAPSATDEQVVAALEYFMHYDGYWTNEVTEANKNTWVKKWTDDNAKNVPALPDFPVYMGVVYDTKVEMMKDYQGMIDFDRQFQGFFDAVTAAGALKTEEEGDTQGLYHELTSAIQEIVTDPDADVQKVMDNCQAVCEQLYKDFSAK